MKEELDFDKVMITRRELGYSEEEETMEAAAVVAAPKTMRAPLDNDKDDDLTSHFDMSFIRRSLPDVSFKAEPDSGKHGKSTMKGEVNDLASGDKLAVDGRSLKASSSVLSSDSSIASRVSRFKLAKEARDREEAARTRRSQASISFKQELSR